MKLQVVGQMIAFTERETLVSGTVNKYRAEFVFDDSWDGYTKTAVFRADSFGRVTSREVLLAGRAPQGARGLKRSRILIAVSLHKKEVSANRQRLPFIFLFY